jgi:hypothetical protein
VAHHQKKISRQQWTNLLMTNSVKAAVEAMAAAEHQPIMGNRGPVFKWSPDITIVDEDEPPLIVDNLQEDAHKEAVIEDDKEEAQEEEVIIKDNSEEQDEDIGVVEAAEDDAQVGEDPVQEGTDEVFELQHDNVGDARSNDGDANNTVDDSKIIAEDPVATEVDKSGCNRYNLRPNQERTYNNWFPHCMDNPASSKSYDDVQFLQQ